MVSAAEAAVVAAAARGVSVPRESGESLPQLLHPTEEERKSLRLFAAAALIKS